MRCVELKCPNSHLSEGQWVRLPLLFSVYTISADMMMMSFVSATTVVFPPIHFRMVCTYVMSPDTFSLPVPFVWRYGMYAELICLPMHFVRRYVLSRHALSADTFCCLRVFVFSPICFVSDKFCCHFVLLPIIFGPILLVYCAFYPCIIMIVSTISFIAL